jgi:hypothetical protein
VKVKRVEKDEKSMLPRELEEILKAYEKSNKSEMKREELSYCWYLPIDVFEYLFTSSFKEIFWR